LHEALEKNFDGICPKNLFDESSEPKSVHKGSSKTHLDTIQFIVENTSAIDLFDESSEPKSVHKGSSKTHLDTIQF
jgi:hypothetical protein